MGHINHVRVVKMTPEQLDAHRARMRRSRVLASQPWPDIHGGHYPADALLLSEDAILPLQTRFTPRQQKVYDARAQIITKLRSGTKHEALAREHNIDVSFIRWIDGRSRA